MTIGTPWRCAMGPTSTAWGGAVGADDGDDVVVRQSWPRRSGTDSDSNNASVLTRLTSSTGLPSSPPVCVYFIYRQLGGTQIGRAFARHG